MAIEIQEVTKRYGPQTAVNRISFAVPNDTIVGFLGPNGAGKSTTLKMITGYLKPDEGSIRVDGIDVSREPLKVKSWIGYLPESNALYYEMYVREYLQFIAGVQGVQGAKKRVEEVIEMTGLMPESNKKIGQLSKGYKQRTGIAAALVHDPRVLILDEPTSGLDPNQIAEIRQLIFDLGKNKMVLFSSHILQEVENICDRVVIIHKGNLVANDTLAGLHTQAGGGIVEVEFERPVEINQLMNLAGINRVEVQNKLYTLYCNEASVVKKELLALSMENNLDIQSVKTKSGSLEEVFRSLTT